MTPIHLTYLLQAINCLAGAVSLHCAIDEWLIGSPVWFVVMVVATLWNSRLFIENANMRQWMRGR
jgi:hypothetical protein